MSVDFFIGWCVDQHHDDDERDRFGDDSLQTYIRAMFEEAVDMISEEAWEELSRAMWHTYDPNHDMHTHHPSENPWQGSGHRTTDR
jgi:hypothetical protein